MRKSPSKKSPYEILGVDKSATPSDLKRAYRSRARNSHPDKGGSHDQMAEVNRAYTLLSDPARKSRYDQTGDDGQYRPLDNEARDMVIGAFHDGMVKDVASVLKHAKDLLTNEKVAQEQQKKKAERDIERFLARRDKIVLKAKKKKKTDEDQPGNLFHILIDQQVEGARGAVQQMNRRIEVCEKALEILADYQSREIDQSGMIFLGHTATTTMRF